MPNCSEHDDRLMELAMGTLAHSDGAFLRAHLARGCPRCSALLAEFRATSSLLPLSLPLEDPPIAIRNRLLQRVEKDLATPIARGSAIATAATGDNRWRIAPMILRAVAACALIALGLAFVQERGAVSQLTAQLHGQTAENSELRNALASESETTRAIRSPSNLMVSMEGAAPPGGVGRIFIDPKLGKWWFAAQGLKPLPVGRTYEFWLIPQGQKGQKPIPAGTFNVDASGTGYLTGAVPSHLGTGAIAAVTDEPAGGVPQPTGTIQIKGSIGN